MSRASLAYGSLSSAAVTNTAISSGIARAASRASYAVAGAERLTTASAWSGAAIASDSPAPIEPPISTTASAPVARAWSTTAVRASSRCSPLVPVESPTPGPS